MTTSSVAKRIQGLNLQKTLLGAVSSGINKTLGRTSYKSFNLDERYPDVPQPPPQTYETPRTTISTLSNGMKVVSRNTADPMINIGLYVNAGSRYCSPDTSGIGHFLESLASEGTPQISPDRFAENLARTGTGIMVQSFRDAMIYQCETFKKNADFALESIAELIWNPSIEDYNLHRIHQEYLWRRGDVMKDAEHEIPEFMHQAAYQGNTVGLPLFCDHDTIELMTPNTISEFIKIFYQPNRIICVGTGIEHSELESLASQTFGDLKVEPQFSSIQFDEAKYTGGSLKMKYDFNNSPENPLTHVGLMFETEKWTSPDLMALCVLNMMMGGGGSFSAGGPGKGMYTRLYRDVLGSHHWIQHVSCSHSVFDDTGLFSIYGVCSPEQSGDLTGVMLREALDMVKREPNTQELDRAKKTLSSNICFEFENRQVVFEDLARQIQVFGEHKTPEMWRDDIMSVSASDVTNVAKRILSSRPTLLAMGSSVDRVPSVEEVEFAIKNSL